MCEWPLRSRTSFPYAMVRPTARHWPAPACSREPTLVYLQWCMAEIEYFLQTKTKVLTARDGSSAPREKAAAKVSKAN